VRTQGNDGAADSAAGREDAVAGEREWGLLLLTYAPHVHLCGVCAMSRFAAHPSIADAAQPRPTAPEACCRILCCNTFDASRKCWSWPIYPA